MYSLVWRHASIYPLPPPPPVTICHKNANPLPPLKLLHMPLTAWTVPRLWTVALDSTASWISTSGWCIHVDIHSWQSSKSLTGSSANKWRWDIRSSCFFSASLFCIHGTIITCICFFIYNTHAIHYFYPSRYLPMEWNCPLISQKSLAYSFFCRLRIMITCSPF